MNQAPAAESSARISIEQITVSVREMRDNGIQALMLDNELMVFMEKHFNTIAISAVKTEFLKRDLKTLKSEPLDLAFYSSLITQTKNGGGRSCSPDHPLFLAELLKVFEKYGFAKT